MVNRTEALHALATAITPLTAALIAPIEEMLVDLSGVRHLDITDRSALGSNIHAALHNSGLVAKLQEHGFSIRTHRQGPANKVVGSVNIEGFDRAVSIELHLSGPRGGVRKQTHQEAVNRADQTFMMFDDIGLPESFLMHLGLFVDITCTRVVDAFLMYADEVDRQCVKLDLAITKKAAERHDNEEQVAAAPKSKIRFKESAKKTQDVPKKKQGDAN